jgi:hypothetical protein
MTTTSKASPIVRTSRLRRPLALLGASALLAAGAVTLGATAASAAVPSGGYLIPSPSTGTAANALTFNTSGPCSNTNATNLQVKMFGSGFPAGGQIVVANSALSAYPQNANGGYSVPMGDTLQGYANIQSPPATFSGTYSFTLICRTNTSGTSLGDYTTKIFFSGSSYSATGPAASASSTALSVTGDQGSVNPQTLSAQVTPTTGGPATGWVEFYDGSTRLGDLVPLNATGGASLSQVLSAGTHQLKAVYTPDDTAAFTGSTSPSTTYPPAPAQATTTTLAVSPSGSAAAYSAVTLAASVDQPAAGTVAFQDGGATLQTVATTVGASSATAQFATSFSTAGSHSFTAVFTPASSAAYVGSTSAAVPYSITAPTSPPVTENITVAISPGSLVLSIANNPDVVLHGVAGPTAPADLNAAGDLLVAAGTLNPITVTDTRTQDQGATHWTVSGSIVDFSDGNGHGISANNLGWEPSVVDKASTQTVTAGAAVTPAHGVASGTSADAVNGLKSPRTLASSLTGSPTGTAHVTAGLTLNAPTNTVPNTVAHPTYAALMTITAA